MTVELTMQLPVIKWTPAVVTKKAAKVAKLEKLEEMSLAELLFVAVGPAL